MKINAPVETEIDMIAANGYTAKYVARFIGRRPAKGDGIIVIINKFVRFRIKIPNKFPQPKRGRFNLIRIRQHKFYQIVNGFFSHIYKFWWPAKRTFAAGDTDLTMV